MERRDPYEVLEIERNASKDEVKKAYRRLAKMYHPDQYINNPLAELAKDKFIEVQEAYDTIIEGKTNNEYGYSGNPYASTRTHYKGRNFSIEEIQIMMENRDYFNAKLALGTIMQKTPQWYYVSGILDIKLGSYNSGLNYLQMATQIEPENETYRKAYEEVKSQMGGYRKSYVSYNKVGGLPLGCCCCQMCICKTCCGCNCIPYI